MNRYLVQVVIIYGPPGSGKGTQAELLARKYNFVHFDTGKYLESLVHDPKLQKSAVIRRERKLFDTGKLNSPPWVLGIVKKATGRVARAGYSIILSGSPRTMFEAFGDKSRRGLLASLAKSYGKKNITIIVLKIRAVTTLKRNGARFVCSVCGLPKLACAKSTRCAFCGGALRKRTLDDPNVIKVRLEEYKNRTSPLLARAKELGFKIFAVDGEPAPYKVHAAIVKRLRLQ